MLSASLNKTFLSCVNAMLGEAESTLNWDLLHMFTQHLRSQHLRSRRKEMFYLTTHSTFYLRLYGGKEMVYLTTHSTHFIYGYMASDIW